MTVRGSTWMIVALLTATGVAACNREATPPIENATTQQSEPRADSELATEVQGRFYADDLVRGGGIDVEVDNGVVTLTGMAGSEQMRERAVELARTVDGVVRVQDQITTQTAQAETAGAPGQEPAESRTGIGTATAPGTATATTAAGQDTRATAGSADRDATARRPISGEVNPNPAWISTQIQARYFSNPDIRASNVDVSTRSGGIVELRGEVEDMQARTEAVRIASEIEGVTRVDDQLRVRNEGTQQAQGDAAAAGATGPAGDVSDAWMTTKVQSKFYLDDDVRGRDIDVETEGAVVTLTGTVESAQERRQAVALARSTDGVRDVQDQLQVRASGDSAGQDAQPRGTTGRSAAEVVEDSWITTKIQAQYFLDSLVKGHEINVDTRNGVVTLKGSVGSEAQKQAAEQIARETEGVSKVANQITLQQ